MEALRDFQHPDGNLFGDPDYEFWIPENMVEMPKACPVAEVVEIPPGAGACAVATGETRDSNSDSDSDEE